MKEANRKSVSLVSWLLGSCIIAAAFASARAEQGGPDGSPKVTVREDVVYGRFQGAGLLIGNALAMVDVLQKASARHTFHRYPNMGHMGINQEVIDRTLAFIKEVSAD